MIKNKAQQIKRRDTLSYNDIQRRVSLGKKWKEMNRLIISMMEANGHMNKGKLEIGLTKLGILYLVNERTGKSDQK